MTAMLVLLLVSVAGSLATGRAVVRDGLGRRPPPATRTEQQEMSTWPR